MIEKRYIVTVYDNYSGYDEVFETMFLTEAKRNCEYQYKAMKNDGAAVWDKQTQRYIYAMGFFPDILMN